MCIYLPHKLGQSSWCIFFWNDLNFRGVCCLIQGHCPCMYVCMYVYIIHMHGHNYSYSFYIYLYHGQLPHQREKQGYNAHTCMFAPLLTGVSNQGYIVTTHGIILASQGIVSKFHKQKKTLYKIFWPCIQYILLSAVPYTAR